MRGRTSFFGGAFCFSAFPFLSFMSNSIPLPIHYRTKPAKAEQPAKKPRPFIYKVNGLWPWQIPGVSRRVQYQIYMVSPFWEARRWECIHLANRGCAACGKQSRLTVHHLTYERIFHEPQSDLLCLCWKHHRQAEDWSKTLKTKPTREQIIDNIGAPPFVPRQSSLTSTIERRRKECEEVEALGFFFPFHSHMRL